MDESPISNPFDGKDNAGTSGLLGYSTDTDRLDADSSGKTMAGLILGAGGFGCCLLAFVVILFYRPDVQPLVDRYFPSPTSTLTPTPNLTATKQVMQITSTARANESLIAEAGGQWRELKLDSFDNVGSSWITGTDDDKYATIVRRGVDRAYQWEATSKQGFISWISANEAPLTDFYLSVEAERLSGSASSDYGLVFREDAVGNFYYIGVSDEGFFISVNYDDEWIDIVEFTYSSVVASGEKNRITVIARGSYFIFLINDIMVAEAEDDRIPSGTTALAIQIYDAGLEATIAFDNFELRAP